MTVALHRHLSGSGDAPEEWVIARLAKAYGALPMPGSVLEQPLRLVLLGDILCSYADAFTTFRENEDHASAGVKRWVMQTAAASAVERRG